MSSENSSSGGIGFFGLLTLLFIGLKLGSVIDWSWWWVLSPLWVPVALALAILLFAVGVMALIVLIGWWLNEPAKPRRLRS